MDHRRAEQNPLRRRDVPHECARLARRRHPRAGNGAPEAREHAENDREEEHQPEQLAAVLSGTRHGHSKERGVFRHREARHDRTLFRSTPAYKARMTSSSGASSIARSRTDPCRITASITAPTGMMSRFASSSAGNAADEITRTPGSASASDSVSLQTVTRLAVR